MPLDSHDIEKTFYIIFQSCYLSQLVQAFLHQHNMSIFLGVSRFSLLILVGFQSMVGALMVFCGLISIPGIPYEEDYSACG